MNLHQILKRAVMGTILMAPALCMAWGAIASNGNTGTHTSTGYGSAAEAEQVALQGCQKMGLPCEITIAGSNTGAFIVYVGSEGLHASFAPDPAEADKRARDGCRRNYKECQLRAAAWDGGVAWLAAVRSDSGSYVAYNYADPAQAIAIAMADCKKNSTAPNTCAILGDSAHQGHVVTANSQKTGHGHIHIHLNLEDAVRGALTGCANQPGRPDDCKVTQQFSNDAPLPAPKAMQALSLQAEKNRTAAVRVKSPAAVKTVRSTSKTTEHYTCETVCQNASCVSKFGDGTIRRWTAQMKHDGFKWALDTTTCGR